MPYVTVTVRVESDVGGQPGILFDYRARVALTEEQLLAVTKAPGDAAGVFTTIATIDHIPAINALVVASDQPVRLKLSAPSIPAWTGNFGYAVGDRVIDSLGNMQLCTTAGNSGALAPAWVAALGQTMADGVGTLVWTCAGLLATDGSIALNAGGILVVVDAVVAAGASLNAQVNCIGATAATLNGLVGGT